MASRIVMDFETLGARHWEVAEYFERDLREEAFPASATAKVRRILEAAGYLDHYDGMKRDKREWLETHWNTTLLPARVRLALEMTAVDTLLAQIVVAGVAIDDEPVTTILGTGGDERTLLENFLATIDVANETTWWIGHNIESFDLPLLHTRLRVYGIRPPANLPVYWGRVRGRVYDTMRQVASSNPYVSLDRACMAHGLAGKTVSWKGAPMDGSRVAEAWSAGAFDLLREYCAADVAATRDLARVLTYDWASLSQWRMPVDRVLSQLVGCTSLEQGLDVLAKAGVLEPAVRACLGSLAEGDGYGC